jgi:hypothetical protein
MPRASFALLVASLTLASLSASGASGGAPTGAAGVTAEAPAKIVLRGRPSRQGPWRRYLWLKLVKVELTSFSVCAVWNRTLPPPPTCRAAPGERLPQGTILRLEQRLPRVAGRVAGWKTVGISTDAALAAVLSNAVSRNRLGTVTYRTTLRNASGRILGTSNAFKVIWHK